MCIKLHLDVNGPFPDINVKHSAATTELLQHGKILFWTIWWQACLTPLAQAGVVKDAKRAVREGSKAHQI